MKLSKRPWTRAEKSLFLVPFLILLGAGAVWRQQRASKWIELPHLTLIHYLQFSPDSRHLIVVGIDKVTNAERGAIFEAATRSKICDLQSPPRLQGYGYPSWSPDGTQVVAGYSDGSTGTLKTKTANAMQPNPTDKIALWNARSGRLIARWPYAPRNEDSHSNVYFSGDGRKLIGDGQPPALFDARSGARLRRFKASSGSKGSGNFNSTQDLVAIQSVSGTKFEVREVATSRVLWQPKVRSASGSIWTQNNVLGVYDFGPKRLLLWDGNTHRILPSPPSTNVFEFSFANNAPLVAVAEVEWRNIALSNVDVKRADVLVWNYSTQRTVWSRKMEGRLFNLGWSPNGKWLAVIEENTIEENPAGSQVWIFNARGEVHFQQLRKNRVWALRWAPDSKQLAIAQDGEVEIMRVDNAD